jgi:hypothetical protein
MTNQTNQEKLDELYELSQENNEILHSLLRREKFATYMRLIYWLVIIGAVFGLYYYVEPVINYISNNSSGLADFFNAINDKTNNFPEVSKIKEILGTFKK